MVLTFKYEGMNLCQLCGQYGCYFILPFTPFFKKKRWNQKGKTNYLHIYTSVNFPTTSYLWETGTDTGSCRPHLGMALSHWHWKPKKKKLKKNKKQQHSRLPVPTNPNPKLTLFVYLLLRRPWEICYFATLNFGYMLLCHPVSMTGGTVCVYDLWVRWHTGEAHKW
jgi:hypothetical protein